MVESGLFCGTCISRRRCARSSAGQSHARLLLTTPSFHRLRKNLRPQSGDFLSSLTFAERRVAHIVRKPSSAVTGPGFFVDTLPLSRGPRGFAFSETVTVGVSSRARAAREDRSATVVCWHREAALRTNRPTTIEGSNIRLGTQHAADIYLGATCPFCSRSARRAGDAGKDGLRAQCRVADLETSRVKAPT